MLIASLSPVVTEIATTRLVSARAALAALHARGVEAHASRRRLPRRHLYVIEVDAHTRGSARLCCARSLLRGAFLCAGSVSGAQFEAHLEIPVQNGDAAARLAARMRHLGLRPHQVLRRGRIWLALRSVTDVATALTSLGAHQGRLEFEDGRVVREVRGGVNRRLNAETANLRRTVIAGVRQAATIAALAADSALWDALPPALREAGELRRQHPEDALAVLAGRAGCSRSAMADRLRRLDNIAAQLGDEFADRPGNLAGRARPPVARRG